tara:strand:+ start:497 stop:847 length:351 start_codon:yes stop_codon:yes gene_type:complete
MSTLTKVTHNVLEDRYTTLKAIGSDNVCNCNEGNIFTKTISANATLNFTNAKVGDVKTVILTGGGDYALTLNANGSAGTFNKLGGTYDGTSGVKNVLELKFVSATEAYYQFSKVTT